MKYIVEIADSKAKTMQFVMTADQSNVSVFQADWRAIDKGMIRHNSGPVLIVPMYLNIAAVLQANDAAGISFFNFLRVHDAHIPWYTVNNQGTGELAQPWVLALEPGRIEWSLV